eukprot:473924-Pelagomonas_calceolata.AAC.1
MIAIEVNMLFILHIILGITEITGRRKSVMPCGLLNFKGMDSCRTRRQNWATLRTTRLGMSKYRYLGRKRGICDMRVLGWESTPVMICKCFAVEVSRMIRKRFSPVYKVTKLEVHYKLTQIHREGKGRLKSIGLAERFFCWKP